MIEKLKKFCADPKYNERIGTPWSLRDRTYATTGFVLISVPRLAEVPERTNTVDLTSLLSKNPVPEDGWVDVPGVDGLSVPECPRCKGKERPSEPCEECDGNGVVDLENSFHDYECTCKSCDGDGEVGGCRQCGGTGYLTDEARIHLAGSEFKTSQILEITRTFGSLQVAPQSPGGGASWIRFEGGNALVMAIHRANC